MSSFSLFDLSQWFQMMLVEVNYSKYKLTGLVKALGFKDTLDLWFCICWRTDYTTLFQGMPAKEHALIIKAVFSISSLTQ